MNPVVTYSPPPRVPALDAVRGLAILTVTLSRFGHRLADGTPMGEFMAKIFAYGDRGVDLFFVLSGFLITGILYDSKENGSALWNFFARRCLRIFPLYYGVLFAFLVVLPLVMPAQTLVNEYTLEHQGALWLYGTNILLSIEWLLPLGVFNHFWSLAVEEHFYIFWPFVIFSCERRRAMNICLFMVGLAMTSRIAIGILQGNHIAASVLTICRLDALAIGSYLALAVRGPEKWTRVIPLAWRWGPICFFAVVVLAVLGKGGFYFPLTFTAIVCASLIVWAVSATDRFSRLIWVNPVLRHLSQYSYAMYVFQNLLLPVVEKYFPIESMVASAGPLLGRLAFIGIGFVVTYVVAVVSWHAYEKHFLKLKRYFES